MSSRTANIIFGLALVVALAGCGNKAREPEREKPDRQQRRARRERTWRIDRPAPTTTQTASTPLPVDVQPTLVKKGLAPLAYIVESPASVSVVDLDTQQRLASAPVGARTIVRVEARTGVVFGEQHVSPGPLPVDHQYGIYLESGQTSEIRNQTISPMPRDQQPQQPPAKRE